MFVAEITFIEKWFERLASKEMFSVVQGANVYVQICVTYFDFLDNIKHTKFANIAKLDRLHYIIDSHTQQIRIVRSQFTSISNRYEIGKNNR